MSTYNKALFLAMMGIYMTSSAPSMLFAILGGAFVGSALSLAKKSGREENL